MVNLSETWYVEPVFDYEYKTYQLRSYTKSLAERFSEWKFYPYLNELRAHLERLEEFKLVRAELQKNLRREVTRIDLDRLKLIRKSIPEDTGVISELGEIVDFAIVHLSHHYRDGLQNLDELRTQVQISPLGIFTGFQDSGFLFFRKTTSTRIYSYHLRIIRRSVADEVYKDVQTTFIDEISTGMFTNFNDLKWDLIRSTRKPEITRAYLVETNSAFPQYETLLPIAKCYLINTTI